MKLYLLSCQNIHQHAKRILPLLPEQRRLAYVRTRSPLSLGAGLLLASVLKVHSDDDLRYGPQGKPFLAAGGPEFNLSHSKEHVLLGVSHGPIGVDIERADRPVSPALKKRVCLPWEKELPFLTVYTRKECAMKLTGLGFSLPLNEIDTTREYTWDGAAYHFLSTTCEGYVISVLSTEEILPEIQKLQPEELL